MTKFNAFSRSWLMAFASSAVLIAASPSLVQAQATDVGGPGKALTTGTVTTSNGNVTDGGANGPVNVSGVSPTVTIVGATVSSTTANSPGINIFSNNGPAGGTVNAILTGTNNISGVTNAITVSGVAENAVLNTLGGGGTYAGGLNANSQGGTATILNGANTITGSSSQTGLQASVGGAKDIIVDSTGGTIVSGFGITASSQGGNVTIGEGACVTTAVTSNGANNYVDIAGTTSGAGVINIRMGAGGTIDGGGTGIYANNANGSGAITVNAGAAIGGITRVGSTAIDARSGSGSINITATAALSSTSNGIYAYVNGGSGSLTISSVGVNSTSGAGVNGSIFTSTPSTGALSYTLTGANQVQGTEAVYLNNAGSGSVSVTAANTGSSFVGANGFAGIEARAAGGAIGINVAGTVSGSSTGVYANSVGAANTNGGGAVNVGSANQRIGAVSGTAANGIFAAGAGDVTVYATQSTGGTRGILAASQSNGTANGAVLIDVTGPVVGGTYGVLAVNNGVLAANTLTIRTAAVTSTFGSAISAQSNAGDISVTASGPIKVNAAANNAWDGIYAAGNNINIAVNATGPVTGTYHAIEANTVGATTKGAITINASGPINGIAGGILAQGNGVGAINIGAANAPTGAITATNGYGVLATGQGDINIHTGAVTASGGAAASYSTNGNVANNPTVATVSNGVINPGSGYGVAATTTGAGAITLDTQGTVTGGAAGGLLAKSATGAIAITTKAVTTAGGNGIEADTSGAVTINAGGTVTGGKYGILVNNTTVASTGAITINAGIVNGGSFHGIAVRNLGSGAINIGSANQRIGAVTANLATGVFATGPGAITFYGSDVTAGGTAVVASSQNTNPNGAVLVDVTGTVTANAGTGIVAQTFSANPAATVTVRANAITSTGGSAVSAASLGGDISVTTTGAVTANAGNGQLWDALYAEHDGNGAIAINASGPLNGSFNAIEAKAAFATSGGAITVAATGPITGGWGGIAASSTGKGGINLGAANARLGSLTTSNGVGVFANGAGDVNVYTGQVTAAGGAAVTLTNNMASGVVQANGPTLSTGYGIAALSSGGNVTVDASGLVTGGAAGGVLAQNTSPTGAITVTTNGVTAAAGRGIEADASGGALSVTANGAVTAANQVGIFTTNTGAGSITILGSGAVTAKGGTGVYAGGSGLGAINIGTATQRYTGAISSNTTGVFAAGAGDVKVYAGAVTGGTRGIVAANQGSVAVNGAVVVDVSGPVVGGSSYGIVAVNNGALSSNSILINAGQVTSTNGTAISAQGDGDITINASGPVLANAGTNGNWDGIYAAYANGGGDSLITVNTTGSVTGSYNGIEAVGQGATTRSGIAIKAGGSVSGSANAILATMAGTGSVSISTAAGATLSSAGGTGIFANVTSATGSNAVNITNLANIGAAGAAQVLNGIVAQIAAGNGGSISIDSSGAINATNAGILASTAGSGSITVGGAGGIGGTIATAGTGIFGSTTSGALAITTAKGGLIAPGAAVGIDARTSTGSITINQGGDIGATGAGKTVGLGISARIASGSGDININSTGGIYVTAGAGLQSAGIYAVNSGTGAVHVTSSGVIDPGAYGVVVQGAGAVTYAATGGGVTGQQGVYAASTGTGGVSVTSTSGANMVGTNGAGLIEVANGGALTANLAGGVTGATSGLIATNTGTGALTITTTGAVTGTGGAGIDAEGASGAVVVTAAGPVMGSSAGIVASSSGTGSTVVTTTGAVAGGGTGIAITSGTGGLGLNVSGSVTSVTGPAINANSAGSAAINIAAGSTVVGRVNGAGTAVIELNTASGQTSTITVGKGAVIAAASGSTSAVAIEATGGSVVVNNTGMIQGTVDFSQLSGANTGQLNNAAGTSFVTTGTSTFSNGNDIFVNAGLLATGGGLTTFDFAGGTNVFTNSGTISVGFNPILSAGSSFQILRVATFNNSGTITLQNGVVGDSIVTPGAAFIGSGASRLAVDTVVGGPGSRSDTLTVGTSSGSTSVLVHDASAPGSFGALNTQGTVIVAGVTHARDFVLDPGSSYYNPTLFGGAIDKPGLFFSQLAVSPTSQATVLISAPKLQAFQFATLPTQVQSLWYDTAPRAERMGELRDALSGPSDGQAKSGLWLKLNFATTDRDTTQVYAISGNTYAYDSGYSQDTTSALAGYDGIYNGGGSAIAYGVSTGYVGSNVDFDQAGSRTLLNGWMVNGYASMVRGDVFLTGTVGGDFLKAKLKAPQLNGYTPQKTDVTSVGGSLELGLRKPVAGGAILEPSVALAYVHSSIDDIVAAGSRFHFDDPESLRFSIGVRMSGAAGGFSFQEWQTRYNVSLRAVSDLMASNKVTVSSGGPDLPIIDNFQKQFVEAEFGFTSHNHNGWTASAAVRDRFNTGYNDLSLNLGLRLHF